MTLTIKEIQALLDATRNQKFRKKTDAQLAGYALTKQSNIDFKKLNPITEERKKRTGNAMRGKTLEELIGEERAAAGRKARSEFHNGRKRPPEVVQQIAATRKATGSYDSPTHGMNGKTHNEETKSKQSVKAQIRQELKRKLGLGKSDSVPRDVLEQEYKKHGL
jgi:hypothetical protein